MSTFAFCLTINIECTVFMLSVQRIKNIYSCCWTILLQVNISAYICLISCIVLSSKFNIVKSVRKIS